MKGNRKRDTKPEIALRAALHRGGLRFRKDFPLRPDTGRLIRADVVFPRRRVAVFVDGCFWHDCPEHGTRPRVNEGYWRPKLCRNVERDRETDDRLQRAGWLVVRVWEHEEVSDVVVQIRAALNRPPCP